MLKSNYILSRPENESERFVSMSEIALIERGAAITGFTKFFAPSALVIVVNIVPSGCYCLTNSGA